MIIQNDVESRVMEFY